MSKGELTCHPSSPARPALDVAASAHTLGRARAVFRYRVAGDVRGIRIPRSGAARRTDGLWRHTCFEAFLRPAGDERYLELNFSPSTAWAAYAFAGYRCRLEPPPALEPPTIRCRAGESTFELEATVRLGGWVGRQGELGSSAAIDLDSAVGLATVIEDVDGCLSYWALAHPRATPDFHAAEGWTGRLAAASSESRA